MATLVITAGMDSIVPETKDKLIAPKISQFCNPAIPELAERTTSLVDAFVLNFDLSLVLPNKLRQAVFSLARKSDDALNEYIEARNDAYAFVRSDRRSVTLYFSALRHFEQCLTLLRQAIDCANVLSGTKQFQTGDRSVLERIATLRNKAHHFAETIKKSGVKDTLSFELFMKRSDAAMLGELHSLSATSNVPFWLTNEGIECSDAHLLYSELSQEVSSTVCDVEICVLMKPSKPGEKAQD